MSIINIVLVFSKLPCFVRKILQGEENKGVELTVYPCNGSRAAECEGGQMTWGNELQPEAGQNEERPTLS
jgi:hypothetical protein